MRVIDYLLGEAGFIILHMIEHAPREVRGLGWAVDEYAPSFDVAIGDLVDAP
jgi:hypothetical protein